MGIVERRNREREQRSAEIVEAAWRVAREVGWASFSVERVASQAELGRATVYGYFDSLEALIAAMADAALEELSERVGNALSMTEALDVPLRFSQASPAAFALLFQPATTGTRAGFSGPDLERVREEARHMLGALHRLAARSRTALPENAVEAEAFLAAIAMAGVTVPELRSSTPLRRRWQDFCLAQSASPVPPREPPAPPESEDYALGVPSLREPGAR